jgi:hypothetical protein
MTICVDENENELVIVLHEKNNTPALVSLTTSCSILMVFPSNNNINIFKFFPLHV